MYFLFGLQRYDLKKNRAKITVESFVELEEKFYSDMKAQADSTETASAGIDSVKIKKQVLS